MALNNDISHDEVHQATSQNSHLPPLPTPRTLFGLHSEQTATEDAVATHA